METREKVLKGQRNRAYAGLHAERKRADKLEAANTIMGFIGVVLAVISLFSFVQQVGRFLF